jgi:hypothetical protein
MPSYLQNMDYTPTAGPSKKETTMTIDQTSSTKRKPRVKKQASMPTYLFKLGIEPQANVPVGPDGQPIQTEQAAQPVQPTQGNPVNLPEMIKALLNFSKAQNAKSEDAYAAGSGEEMPAFASFLQSPHAMAIASMLPMLNKNLAIVPMLLPFLNHMWRKGIGFDDIADHGRKRMMVEQVQKNPALKDNQEFADLNTLATNYKKPVNRNYFANAGKGLLDFIMALKKPELSPVVQPAVATAAATQGAAPV